MEKEKIANVPQPSAGAVGHVAQPVCPSGWVEKTAGVEIGKYLMPFIDLYEIYSKSHKYLPTLKNKKIYVVPFNEEAVAETVAAYVCRDSEDASTYYIAFREHPPSEVTLAHELIHVAGGDELPAYNYSMFLIYAITMDLPPFNLLDLLNVDLETINKALRSVGFEDLEDYLNIKGIVPLSIADIDLVNGRIKLKKDVDEGIVVQTFLAELAGTLTIWYEFGDKECEMIDCRIFEYLAAHSKKSS